jgi:hypothetical protein
MVPIIVGRLTDSTEVTQDILLLHIVRLKGALVAITMFGIEVTVRCLVPASLTQSGSVITNLINFTTLNTIIAIMMIVGLVGNILYNLRAGNVLNQAGPHEMIPCLVGLGVVLLLAASKRARAHFSNRLRIRMATYDWLVPDLCRSSCNRIEHQASTSPPVTVAVVNLEPVGRR